MRWVQDTTELVLNVQLATGSHTGCIAWCGPCTAMSCHLQCGSAVTGLFSMVGSIVALRGKALNQ